MTLLMMKPSLGNVSISYLLVIFGGALSSILGASVLFGWVTHNVTLIQVSAVFVPMQFNTALGFMLGGLGLLFIIKGFHRTGMACGIFVMLLGLLTLVEYIFGINLGIDQLLMQHTIMVETSHPGRMAPNTALCFSLTGAALVVLGSTVKAWKPALIAGILGSLTLGLGFIALTGYAFGFEAAYGWGSLTRMAVHTAGGFMIFGVAMISLAWHLSVIESSNLPSWFPLPVGIGVMTITISMWQALNSHEAEIMKQYPHSHSLDLPFIDNIFLLVGIVLAAALSLMTYLVQATKNRAREVVMINRRLVAEINERTQAEEALQSSEASFRALYDNNPLMFFTIDEAGKVLSVNQFGIDQLGYLKDQLVGQPMINVFYEEDRSLAQEYLKQCFAEPDRVRNCELRKSRQDGTVVYVRETIRVVADADGKPMALIVCEDITERMQAKEALHESEERFRASFADAAIGMTLVSLDHSIIEANQAFCEMLGYSKEEFVGVSIKDITHPDDVATSLDHHQKLIAGEIDRYHFEKRYLHKQGHGIWVMLSVSMVRDKDATPLHIIAQIQDITERKQVEEELRHYAHIVFSTTDKLAFLNKQYIYTAANPAYLEAFGLSSEQVIGHTVAEVLGEEFFNTVKKPHIDRCLAGESINFQEWFNYPVQGKRFMDMTYSPYIDSEHKVQGCVISGRDITERKQAEEEITRYSRIFEDSLNEIYLFDAESLNFVQMNKAAQQNLGYSMEELHELTPLDIKPEFTPDSFAELLAPLRKGEKEIIVFETVHERKDKSRYVVEIHLQLLKHDHESLFVAFTMDITERKRAGEQLRKLAQAVEQSPDSIIITNLDAEIEYVNEAFVRRSGYSQKELMGKNPRIMQSGKTPPETHVSMWDALIHGRAWKGEFYNRGKDGTEYIEFAHIAPIHQPDGTITHYVSIQEDITEKKRLAQELNDHRQHLEELVEERTAQLEKAKQHAEVANVAKSKFLANMSHELRTPLNAIIGYSEMLQEEAEELEQKTFSDDLQKIHEAGRHLLGLINDILDLSKIEAGKVELLVEPFSVAELLNEVTDIVQPLVEKQDNTLEVVSDGELGEMEGDLLKVRQVLFNLINNAAKFTEHGNITLTASREPIDGRDWLMFAVSDTGIGINKAQLGQVFGEFSQADRTTTRQYGGTGLGLTISRKLCQLMEGDISVKSVPGEGSTFTVRLPAQLRLVPREEEPGLTGSLEQFDASMETGPLVLVIDDELHARELMTRHLHKAGFQVAHAANGREGLELAKQINPVAITLDVLMPEMDGWEVVQALKEDPDLAAIPVVMCTVVDDEQHGFSLGIAEYLTKPINPKRLQRVLNQLCPGGDCNVLVVEDDEVQRRLISQGLQSGGWQVFEAKHGREALELLWEKSIDIILLDLLMPEMDGFEFVEAMQKDPVWREIPVVVVTSKNMTSADRSRLNGYVETIISKGDHGLSGVIRDIQKVLRHKVIVGKRGQNRNNERRVQDGKNSYR